MHLKQQRNHLRMEQVSLYSTNSKTQHIINNLNYWVVYTKEIVGTVFEQFNTSADLTQFTKAAQK